MKKLLLIALLIVGCENHAGSSNTDSLIGTWSMTEIQRTNNGEGFINISDENHYWILTFNSDGSFRWEEYDNGAEQTSVGEWSIANSNELTLSPVYDSDHDDIILYYTLNTNTLIISYFEAYEHGVTDGMYITFQRH